MYIVNALHFVSAEEVNGTIVAGCPVIDTGLIARDFIYAKLQGVIVLGWTLSFRFEDGHVVADRPSSLVVGTRYRLNIELSSQSIDRIMAVSYRECKG